MLDPIPPIPLLSKAVEPLADFLGFTTLPLHVHEVVVSFFAYTFINKVLAPVVSTWLFPVRYRALSPEKKLNWDVHCVSLCQSCMINFAALWVMFIDEERKNMDWEERVWGYTGGAGMIQGLAAGYFLWDLVLTVQYVKIFGVGMLAHAICALTVFSFGFRPFVNYYSCVFILYELSSPFLNFHWFFDKLDMTGSKPQLYNGIVLLITFFGCRLVWGTYSTIRVYQDIWRSLHHTPAAAAIQYDSLTNITSPATPLHLEMMRFAGDEHVPIWLALTYLASNTVLNTLNFFWFGKMIEAVRKRFPGKEGKEKKKEKPVAMKITGINGAAKISIDQTEVKRRKLPVSPPAVM